MYNNVLSSSTNPKPHVHLVGQLYDIREWLGPYVNRIEGISKAHHFWFYLDEAGEVRLKFKEFITDPVWRPYDNEDPLEIFRRNVNGEQIVPDEDGPYSVPHMVRTNFYAKVELDELVKSVDKCEKMMDLAAYAWWLSWMKRDQVENVWDGMADRWDWPLNQLQQCNRIENLEPIEEAQRDLINVSTQGRSLNLLINALKHTIGLFAVYKPKRDPLLQVGMIKEATNEEATLFRFEEKSDGKWAQGKGRNKVPKESIIKLFPKFNKDRTLPQRIRDILDAGYLPESGSENEDDNDD
jgi:hypothetical protein